MHIMRWCRFVSATSAVALADAGQGQLSGPQYRHLWKRYTKEKTGDSSQTPTKLIELSASQNAAVRYREPELCETPAGVRSFSGLVDLIETSHSFFWFLVARLDPETAPITLWLNGGPGSDSLMGLFQ